MSFLADVFGAVECRRMTGEAGGTHCELELGDSVVMVGEGGTPSLAMLHVYVDDSDGV